jgi:hypothetical protein
MPEPAVAVPDNGDALSPKWAPEMTAPAVISGERFMLTAMPMSPIPKVPATVHELPMLHPMTAQISAVVA